MELIERFGVLHLNHFMLESEVDIMKVQNEKLSAELSKKWNWKSFGRSCVQKR